MKRLLLVILSFFILMGAASADRATQDILDEVIQQPLVDKIMSHPDVVEMEPEWFRIVIKDNISETAFDWRFDVRMIDIKYDNIVFIGHRLEQNSGNIPDSNWVIEYSFLVNHGTLEYFDKSRFVSIKDGEGWFRVGPSWPDEHRYGDLLSDEEALELYKKELEWWENKL